MNKDNDNFDNLTPLASAASQLHELYEVFKKSGFSRSEALKIVIEIMVASMNGSSETQNEE